MAEYKDMTGYRELFDEEYKKTKKLILQGETHLDNLAEGFTEADMVICKIPTADVVEVVRCKECKNYSNFDAYKAKRLDFHFCKKFNNITRENDFCSYGERKGGESMKDELIERLHGSELFLRNIAKAKPAPLNGYSKECLLDASEYICQAIEEIHRLNNNLEAMAVTMSNSAKATRAEAIKDFAERVKTYCRENVIFDSSTEEGEFMAFIDNLVKERAGEG